MSTKSPSAANGGSDTRFIETVSCIGGVGRHFTGSPRICGAFLTTLRSCRGRRGAVCRICVRITSLFSDRPSLLRRFILFLPRGRTTTVADQLDRGNVAPTTPPPDRIVHGSAERVIITRSTPGHPTPTPLPPDGADGQTHRTTKVSGHAARRSTFFRQIGHFLKSGATCTRFLGYLGLFYRSVVGVRSLIALIRHFVKRGRRLFN